ncbi:ATP-binding protein [Fischerella sp. PCC 9605]|uniref:ATP-binding protein n=1 Tax=Fischerella sp. PCC 9605 TaxID=1173024 RepID=UPI00047CC36C|nr:ATP-binding protein [Fischerella sp. PCC 9605]
MSSITISTPSKIVSTIALLLAGVALFGFIKGSQSAKGMNLIIFLCSAGAAITNTISSSYYQTSINRQFENCITERDWKLKNYEKELTSAKIAAEQLIVQLKKVEENNQSLEKDLRKKDELVNLFRVRGEGIKKEYGDKINALNAKLAADDTRFLNWLKEFVAKAVTVLEEKVNRDFDRLADSIKRNLDDINYRNAHPQLKKHLTNYEEKLEEWTKQLSWLERSYDELMTEIDDFKDYDFENTKTLFDGLETVEDVITTAVSIYDQISAFKVRYRNALNIDERLEVYKLREQLNISVPQEKALSALQDFSATTDEDYQNLEQKRQYLEGLINSSDEYVQGLLKELDAKNERIAKLEQPIEWRSGILDAQDVGNLIIRFFWKRKIRLDRAFIQNDPYEPILYFAINRLEDLVNVEQLNKFSEALQQHVDLLLEPPHFKFNGEYGLLQTKIKLATKPKPNKEELVSKIPDCKSLVSKSTRGFLVTGDPGSGKTSAMKALAQWLGNESSMRLALNPHSDEKSDFTESGFVEVNELEEIYEAIRQLDVELKLRGKDKTRRQTLIVAVDELGRIIKDAPKDLDVMEILRQAAVEGRKFNVIVLIANHSQTTKAIEMDSQYRGAFYQLFLVGAATHKLNQPNSPALKQYEEEWIKSAPYPVLVSINGRYQACQHPTHYTYKEYRDSGNPPVGLVKISATTIKVGNRDYLLTNEKTTFTDSEKELISNNQGLVNLKTGAGLSLLIERVFEVKASKSEEYKALKDKVLEYLKTIS